MSSLALIDTFFPTTAALLPDALRSFVSPQWALEACPVPTAALPLLPLPRQLDVAWPSLLAATLASVPLALLLASQLERRARKLGASQKEQQELRLWRDACALFGGMNASAALAHCLLAPAAARTPLAWPLRLARAADVAFTGASSTFLIAASAARRAASAARRAKEEDEEDEAAATQRRRRRRVATGAALAVAVLAFAGNAVPTSVASQAAATAAASSSSSSSLARRAALAALAQGQLPFANEAAYLGPTLLAAAFLSLSDVPPSLKALWRQLHHRSRAAQHFWIVAAAVAAALGFSAVALDAPCCAMLGSRGFELGFNGVTVLFVACDLIFVALTRYALAAADEEEEEEAAAGGGRAGEGKAGAVIHLTAVAAAAAPPPATPAAAAKARHAATAVAADAALANKKKLF